MAASKFNNIVNKMSNFTRNSYPCWICLKCTKGQNHHRSAAFQMLLRYLLIDLRKLWGNSYQNKFNMEGEFLSLCGTCAVKMDEFWELYQELEAIRLSLDNSFQSLYDVITDSKLAGAGKCKETEVTCEIRKLRDETLRKSTLQLRSLPQVALTNAVFALQKEKGNKASTPVSSEVNASAPINPETDSETDSPDLMDNLDCDTDTDMIEVLSSNSDPIKPPPTKRHVNEVATAIHPDPLSWEGLLMGKNSNFGDNRTTQESCNNSCQYCLFRWKSPSDLTYHMITSHPLKFYSNQVPPGTTESILKEATLKTIQKHREHPFNCNSNAVFKCASCPSSASTYTTPSFKTHILRHHFHEVVTTLMGSGLVASIPVQSTFSTSTIERFSPVVASDDGVAVMIVKPEPLVIDLNEPAAVEDNVRSSEETTSPNIPTEKVSLPRSDTSFKHFQTPLRGTRMIKVLITKSVSSQRTNVSMRTNKNNKIENKYKCPRCTKVFTSQEEFHNHKISKHSNFPCLYCDATHFTTTIRRNHMILVHTFLFFKKQLPLGTTEEELTNAIKKVVSMSKGAPFKDSSVTKYRCPELKCSKTCSHPYFIKMHALTMHFQLVVKHLPNRDKMEGSCDPYIKPQQNLTPPAKPKVEEFPPIVSSGEGATAEITVKLEPLIIDLN